MGSTIDYLFGPLSKDYCLWFYFLAIWGFVMFAMLLILAVIYGISKRKGIEYYFGVIIASLPYFIFYFQNRLLHTMCVEK
jgi:hypothetical protein